MKMVREATGAPVQLYSVRDGCKVSAGGDLAIEDAPETKNFYAKSAVVAHSNAILGALRSRVRLADAGAAPHALPGLRAFTPTRRNDDRDPFNSSECNVVADNMTGSNQTHAIFQGAIGSKHLQRQSVFDLASLHRLIETFTRTSDVSSGDMARGQRDREPEDDNADFSFSLHDVSVSTDSQKAVSSELQPVIPNMNLRIALVKKVLLDRCAQMPQIQQELMDLLRPLIEVITVRATEVRTDEEFEAWVRVLNDATNQVHSEQSSSYRRLEGEDLHKRAEQTGVNEHARPDVGESYGVVGTRARTEEELNAGRWSFHFAAVIGRDGHDSVTLENYNRMGAENGDGRWYFDMHGAREQSFHEKHKGTVADGMTLRFGAPVSADDKETLLLRVNERYDSSPMVIAYRLRVQRAQTRAELAAIEADAFGAP